MTSADNRITSLGRQMYRHGPGQFSVFDHGFGATGKVVSGTLYHRSLNAERQWHECVTQIHRMDRHKRSCRPPNPDEAAVIANLAGLAARYGHLFQPIPLLCKTVLASSSVAKEVPAAAIKEEIRVRDEKAAAQRQLRQERTEQRQAHLIEKFAGMPIAGRRTLTFAPFRVEKRHAALAARTTAQPNLVFDRPAKPIVRTPRKGILAE